MGKLILLLWLFLSCSLLTAAQDTAFVAPKASAIEGNITNFSVDNTGNIYLVINNQQLKKLNEKADSVGVFNEVRRYGKIYSVDVSNPLKILVYYRDMSTVIVLDRFLSIKNIIDLRKSNIQQAKAVRLSYDNNIWVYDELNNKIRKLDDNGKLLMESADLRNVFAEAPSVEAIFDDSKNLFLYDPLTGWFVFDYYGAFTKRFAFINWKDPQVIGGMMTGRSDTSYYTARPGDFDYKTHAAFMNLSNARKVLFTPSRVYVLHIGRLEIFPAP